MIKTIVKLFVRSIIILYGIVMLFSCKNDMSKVQSLMLDSIQPTMRGEGLELLYSDSARIKYRILTPEYIQNGEDDEAYEEFPKGVEIISYDKEGNVVGSIKAKYAIKRAKEEVWEARHDVVVKNKDGKKLETELLFWNMQTARIYSDRYTRLTADDQIIEGNNGFESDQDLNDVTFKSITGQVEVENKQ